MNNIIIIGLDYNKIKSLAKKLSDKLSMYFLDIYDYIEYDIANREEMIKTCGIKYYVQQEQKIVKASFSYENMLINIRFNQLFRYLKYNNPGNNLFIYLQTEEKNITKNMLDEDNKYFDADSIGNYITYENRNDFLNNNCDIIIKYNTFNEKNIINKILLKLKEVSND